MKKGFIVCAAILILTLLFFWNDIRGYSSLEKAVQSEYKSTIQVVNKDQTNKLFIFKDQDQYVFGAFRYRGERYYYKNDSQSSAWTAQSKTGIAFLVNVETKRDKGNFIWGALYTDIPIANFQIQYKNGEIEEVESVNNTFIRRIPHDYQNEKEPNLMTTFYDVKAYDKDNNLIETWRD